MVVIVNKSPEVVRNNPKGECTYTLQINDKVLAEFTHKRGDGLAVCLRKAAVAAEEAENNRLLNYLRETDKTRKDYKYER